MVVRRFLAVLSPACEYEETSLRGRISQEVFTAKGNVIRQAGWKEVYEAGYEDADEEEAEEIYIKQTLPEVHKGAETAGHAA